MLVPVLLYLALFVVCAVLPAVNSAPDNIEVQAGEISDQTITAPRDVVDQYTTDLLRQEAMQKIRPVYKQDEMCIRDRVSLAGYLKARQAVAMFEGRIQLKVLRAGGILKLADFCRRRKFLVIGAAVLAVVLFVLSLFVWKIEINGTETLNEFMIYQAITEQGVHEGMQKSEIDLHALNRSLLDKFPKIVYANLYFNGVNLVVDIVEGIDVPKMVVEDRAADVVAKADALIEKVTPIKGEAIVEPGDVVKKGDVLISGQYVAKETVFSTAADGEVIGRVWYTGEAEAEYSAFRLEGTGNKLQASYLKIGADGYPIFTPQIPFEKYLVYEEKDTVLGQNMPMPVHKIDAVIEEAKEVSDEQAKETAKMRAREAAYFNAIKEIPEDATLVGFDIEYQETQGKITARATVETLENIAEQSFGPEGSAEQKEKTTQEEER